MWAIGTQHFNQRAARQKAIQSYARGLKNAEARDAALDIGVGLIDGDALATDVRLLAWFSLVDYGQIQPGQTVLVHGTGGVSIFAVQLATALGAKVIVTSSSDANLEAVKKLGAVAGVNYRTYQRWEEQVPKLTDSKGVDLLLDVAGGEGLNQSILASKAAGYKSESAFSHAFKRYFGSSPRRYAADTRGSGKSVPDSLPTDN